MSNQLDGRPELTVIHLFRVKGMINIMQLFCMTHFHSKKGEGLMRKFGVISVGLLALVVLAACVPIPEPDQTIVETTATLPAAATAAPQAVATATSLPEATATPALQRRNVALLGTGHASAGNDSAHLAIDGDLNSIWSSQGFPTQWFAVVLDVLYPVDRIEMVITQAPAGPTTHEVWLGSGSDTRTLYKRLSDVHTEDGQTLEVVIEPPRMISEVLILTRDSPSWVAWREVRVFALLPADTTAVVNVIAEK